MKELWTAITTYIFGALTGGWLKDVVEHLFALLQSERQSAAAARRIVEAQLDPLLKAADELQGKLRSIAEEDFKEFRCLPNIITFQSDLVNVCSTLYLLAQFWCRLEILRRETFHADLTRDKRGKILMDFLFCLESRKVRLVDRAWQRAIGECAMTEGNPRPEVMLFKSFVHRYQFDGEMKRWLEPLEQMLRECKYPRARQRVLQYGVVVHALIDTLDPKHYTTRDRPGYPNKLSHRTKKEIEGRVFGIYLREVKNKAKYLGARPE